MKKPSPRADLVGSAAWLALATAVLVASWSMDRLERLGAKLYSAPGLVPGLLGAMLFLLSLALAVRALRQGALRSTSQRQPLAEGWATTALVLALCLGYALVLVGRVPFWLATFAFVSVFIAVFEYPDRRRMAVAPLYGAATAFAVTWMFESVFLVRLP